MKKNILLICLIVLFLSLTSCNSNYYSYKNAEKYSVGRVSLDKSIEQIDVDWVSGKINIIRTTSDDQIYVYETANKTLDKKEELRYYLKDGVLDIRFAEKGWQDFNNLNKELTIALPNDFNLDSLNITTIAADVEIGGIVCNLDIETVLGDINGQLQLCDEVDIETVSGNIELTMSSPKEFDFSSVSGDIEVLIMDTFPAMTNWEGNIDTVSGDIKVCLNKWASFLFEIETVSGDISSDFPCIIKNNEYLYQNDDNKCDISSVSGNIHILDIE
ncbi:MAG: DUF4097 family beta strand repeat protein [Bacilli bacterium]|nr:DUF4097 family beta strand repeat protein [Bacilli bacterium]